MACGGETQKLIEIQGIRRELTKIKQSMKYKQLHFLQEKKVDSICERLQA